MNSVPRYPRRGITASGRRTLVLTAVLAQARRERLAHYRACWDRTAQKRGFGLAAALDLEAPGISRTEAVELMEWAHEECPYSRATRGNIDVTLTVGGATVSGGHR
jgi:organic hydroperoxide reductase OsmC/OhrA